MMPIVLVNVSIMTWEVMPIWSDVNHYASSDYVVYWQNSSYFVIETHLASLFMSAILFTIYAKWTMGNVEENDDSLGLVIR